MLNYYVALLLQSVPTSPSAGPHGLKASRAGRHWNRGCPFLLKSFPQVFRNNHVFSRTVKVVFVLLRNLSNFYFHKKYFFHHIQNSFLLVAFAEKQRIIIIFRFDIRKNFFLKEWSGAGTACLERLYLSHYPWRCLFRCIKGHGLVRKYWW